MTGASELQTFAKCVCLAWEKGVLRKLTFSSPKAEGSAARVVGHLSTLRGKTILALEAQYKNGKVEHIHLAKDGGEDTLSTYLDNYLRAHLSTSQGDCEYMVSNKGKITLLKVKHLMQSMSQNEGETFILPLNREISYIFDGTAPFLQHLGISDKNGRVYDKKQAKFRQINKFLEHVATLYDALPKEDTLLVYDLCCGKSYLSFALYAYLHDLKGREVDMLCVDLKADVIAYCKATAEALGFDGMRFASQDIRLLPKDQKPDMVVSLHACDIATDIVLDTAISLGAEVILSTPCCHRYINGKLNRPELAFIYENPHLAVRLGETLTDAIRLLRLASHGYDAQAVEFIGVEDTPKNTLIRAKKQPHFTPEKAKQMAKRYEDTLFYLLGDNAKDYLKDIL